MKLVLGALTGLALAVPVVAQAQDPTPSPTPTATATATATETATATATATVTATATATATETATATATATVVPTATEDPTEEPTEVPTEVPTEEPIEEPPPLGDDSSFGVDPPSPDTFSSDDVFSDNGTDGSTDTPSGVTSSTCNGKRTVTFTLPRSYRRIKSVRVTVRGRVQVVRVLAGRKLRVSLTSKRGDTNIVVRKKGHPTVKRIAVLCSDDR
jgi:hypothetical protein